MGGEFYANVTRVAKRITYNMAKAVFGFDESTNIGKIHFVSIQASSSFGNSFPHIFPGHRMCSPSFLARWLCSPFSLHLRPSPFLTAWQPTPRRFPASFRWLLTKVGCPEIVCCNQIDPCPDPYFRVTRDVAVGLKFAKPSLIHARFLDSLGGPGTK